MLKLSTRFETNYSSCTGRGSENIRNSSGGAKLILPPILVEKLVWVPVISFCKISFPVRHLVAYCAKIGCSRRLITWLTLQITLMYQFCTDSLSQFVILVGENDLDFILFSSIHWIYLLIDNDGENADKMAD
jgi:hypothetical protein